MAGHHVHPGPTLVGIIQVVGLGSEACRSSDLVCKSLSRDPLKESGTLRIGPIPVGRYYHASLLTSSNYRSGGAWNLFPEPFVISGDGEGSMLAWLTVITMGWFGTRYPYNCDAACLDRGNSGWASSYPEIDCTQHRTPRLSSTALLPRKSGTIIPFPNHLAWASVG
jgi:hypothetical protein